MNEVTRNRLLGIGGVILFIVVYGIALKVSDYGGLDIVSSRHANLAAARLVGVIERGWVPELLPAGSNDIWETHNLDTNIGGGGFQFPSNDLEACKKPSSPIGWHRSDRVAREYDPYRIQPRPQPYRTLPSPIPPGERHDRGLEHEARPLGSKEPSARLAVI